MLITGRLKTVLVALLMLFIAAFLHACFSESGSSYHAPVYSSQRDDAMAVANRNSGDLSLINTRTLQVKTIDLSYAGKAAEPMYVNHWRSQHADWGQIFIGDRKNNRILALDDRGHQVVYAIPVGKGVFHQAVRRDGSQLWVVNDIDKTLSVINPDWSSVVRTIHIPAQYNAGKPHDVYLSERYAYVTVIGLNDGNRLLRYNLDDFRLSKQINISGGGHVVAESGRVYVVSESEGELQVYRESDLTLSHKTAIPNAHGLVAHGSRVYVTNIAGRGNRAVWEFTQDGKRSFGSGNTWFNTPHNVAPNARGTRLFVTHSGALNNHVSVMAVGGANAPAVVNNIKVGVNPFGLGLVRNTFWQGDH